jgi:hypothetical protein
MDKMATPKKGTGQPSIGLARRPRTDRIYQLQIVLDSTYPEIWRRVVVPGAIRLSGLHQVIQAAMGWGQEHPHEFRIRGETYGDPDPEFGMGDEIKDEYEFRLAEVVRSSRARFRYLYDFGDCWWHTIAVEKIQPDDGGRYPVCTAGAGNHVPEDCGGPGGFQTLLRILADPNDDEHEETLAWVGGSHDPKHFDIDGINRKLAKLRMYAGLRHRPSA